MTVSLHFTSNILFSFNIKHEHQQHTTAVGSVDHQLPDTIHKSENVAFLLRWTSNHGQPDDAGQEERSWARERGQHELPSYNTPVREEQDGERQLSPFALYLGKSNSVAA